MRSPDLDHHAPNSILPTMAQNKIRHPILWIALVTLLCAFVYLFLEGIASVSRGDRPSTSIAHQAYARLAGGARGNAQADLSAAALADKQRIESLLAKFRADGVALGNTPYGELKTEQTTTRTVVNGCTRHKPNLRKALVHLKTRLFDPFDPVTAFWDADRKLDPDVQSFLDQYGFEKRTVMSTNEFGDRVTLPEVKRHRKVIVAGDSVANGALLNDDETIASRLQAFDLDRQYINTGIHGAEAAEVICAIEAAVENYGGEIDELIYVYCENDFEPGVPYGEPEEVVAWLTTFAAQQDIRKVTVVYAPMIYNVVPELTRFRGDDGYDHPDRTDKKRRLAAEANNAGFRFIDVTDIALQENRNQGTMFAALALFVDHGHLSPLGVEKLIKKLRDPN